MEVFGALPEFLLEPNLLYGVLVVAAWIAVLALLIPGTGVIEFFAAAGLLLGLGGMFYIGSGWPGLLVTLVAFALYALAMFRQFTAAQDEKGHAGEMNLLLVAGVASLLQVIGGLLITANVPGLAWWFVIVLALLSLAVYRWMLLPAASALRPPPQTGEEALVGLVTEVRAAPTKDRPATIFVDGELWQVISEDDLQAGDQVQVVARQGMRLVVKRVERPGAM
ncbi:MAG: hypothetical protein Kow0077_12310 [Anaerolineae bacterium]